MIELTDDVFAALEASGENPATVAAFRQMAADPRMQYAMLPLEEQKRITVDAALQTAAWFIEDARLGYVHDPMAAWWNLSGQPWACHNRALPTYALPLIRFGALDPETAKDLAVFAWRVPEWPEANGGTDMWRAVWQRVGFCSDEEDVAPPTERMTLYRGAVPKYKRGMAWTGDLDRARWFAARFPKSEHFGQGRVYAADVDPARVYARILGRSEDEWVIDTRRLPIRTLEVPK